MLNGESCRSCQSEELFKRLDQLRHKTSSMRVLSPNQTNTAAEGYINLAGASTASRLGARKPDTGFATQRPAQAACVPLCTGHPTPSVGRLARLRWQRFDIRYLFKLCQIVSAMF
jgi:hypothetical protein